MSSSRGLNADRFRFPGTLLRMLRGRNILTGPGRWNLDSSLFKTARVTEKISLQFRGEFFNIFNHPQFDLPNGTIGSASAGKISSTVGSPREATSSMACDARLGAVRRKQAV